MACNRVFGFCHDGGLERLQDDADRGDAAADDVLGAGDGRAAERAREAEEAARRFFEQRFTEWLRGDLKLGRDVTVDIRWTE